ncbi:MAG: hypothetical protein OEZ43_21570 [Gammaproteobacteria bacterium]|nr:hypothetical protein [Gammaproteobacteria bacterium]
MGNKICINILACIMFVPFLANIAHADSSENANGGTSKPYLFELSYYGETFFHPGLRFSVGRQVFGSARHAFVASLATAYYFHFQNSHNYFIDAGLDYYWNFDSGMFLNLGISQGYIHTFAAGDVLEYRSGAVYETFDFGYGYYKPGANFGFGYDLSRLESVGKPMRVYFKAGAFGQYPLNQLLIYNIFAEVGVSYAYSFR